MYCLYTCSYRLSPKHPYPVPLDDCEIATKYFLENAQKYNVDAKRVAVMGKKLLKSPTYIFMI